MIHNRILNYDCYFLYTPTHLGTLRWSIYGIRKIGNAEKLPESFWVYVGLDQRFQLDLTKKIDWMRTDYRNSVKHNNWKDKLEPFDFIPPQITDSIERWIKNQNA